MNNNAIAKLGEAKFCILSHCMSVGLSHAAPWLFSFYSMQKVSIDNKYSRHV